MTDRDLDRRCAFTERLRKKVKEKVGICPTCGQNTLSLRNVAKQANIHHTALWRFISGKSPSSEIIDSLVSWLNGGFK